VVLPQVIQVIVKVNTKVMRSIKIKKEQRPVYTRKDTPLENTPTVGDTTFYSRAKSMMPEQPTPKPIVPKAMKAKQEKEAGDALKKARKNLEKDFTKPLNPKS